LAATIGTLRTQFIRRDLAVAIFVELLQRLRSVGDLLGRNDAVMIRIERGHQRRDRAMFAPAASLAPTLRPASPGRRIWLAVARGRLIRKQSADGNGQDEREEMFGSNHTSLLFGRLKPAIACRAFTRLTPPSPSAVREKC
jgi:hypothetical protein